MDLVARVQSELTSEEKCIKISFSPYIMANFLLASTASAGTELFDGYALEVMHVILEARKTSQRKIQSAAYTCFLC